MIRVRTLLLVAAVAELAAELSCRLARGALARAQAPPRRLSLAARLVWATAALALVLALTL